MMLKKVVQILCLACVWSLVPSLVLAVEVTVLDNPQMRLRLAPGATSEVRLQIRNTRSEPIAAFEIGSTEARSEPQYSFSSRSPACQNGVWQNTPGAFDRVVFAMDALAVGATRECSFRIGRRSSSNSDLELFFRDLVRDPFYVGNLPDLALGQESLPVQADGSRLVRLTVENSSDSAVLSAPITTTCESYQGGPLRPTNHIITRDFPGACDAGLGRVCIVFNQQVSSYGFATGAIPARGSASCWIKMLPVRARGSSSSFFALGRDPTAAAPRVVLANNNYAFAMTAPGELEVALGQINQAVEVPTLSRFASLLLVALMLVMAQRRL